ncbi:hypothetical protein GW17_00002130 [Ensete ventricosum]|nr:hypothetical protein GW17_00002130 [Ensete ventricosum]
MLRYGQEKRRKGKQEELSEKTRAAVLRHRIQATGMPSPTRLRWRIKEGPVRCGPAHLSLPSHQSGKGVPPIGPQPGPTLTDRGCWLRPDLKVAGV